MIFVTLYISIFYFEGKSNYEVKPEIPTIFLLICISWRKCTYIFLLMHIRENCYFYMLVKTLVLFFFCHGFLSQILTILRTVGEGTGPSFIPRYHFHLVTNIKTFICNFGYEMSITYF